MALTADGPRHVDYVPRSQFRGFHCRSQRWAVIVAHRRAGKTVACVMELITRALATPKKDARYAYIAPFREQAKTVAWQYLKQYAQAVVKNPAEDFRESELMVRLFNGSTVRLFGADNPNALRGMYLDGVVMDEYADMRPALWGEVIRPTLSDRKGWAVFIGTPKGWNAFYELLHGDGTPEKPGALNDPDWFTLTLRASQTKILPDEELASQRKTMSENQYEQEFECSFDAAVLGAIYAKELKITVQQERIRRVPYDGSKMVFCAFDIGRRDATSIWFYQVVSGEVRLIDFYEDSMETAAFYASILRGRNYQYDTLYLPHDADKGEAATGVTFSEVMRSNGFRVEVLKAISVEDGINAARMLFPKCVFDREKCAKGLEALKSYRWSYNEHMGELKTTPLHNWASHAADSFRYLALSVRTGPSDRPKYKPIQYRQQAYV